MTRDGDAAGGRSASVIDYRNNLSVGVVARRGTPVSRRDPRTRRIDFRSGGELHPRPLSRHRAVYKRESGQAGACNGDTGEGLRWICHIDRQIQPPGSVGKLRRIVAGQPGENPGVVRQSNALAGSAVPVQLERMGAVLVVKGQDRVRSGGLILEVTFGASIGDRRRGARRVSLGVRGEGPGRLKQIAISLPPVVSQARDFDMDQVIVLGLIAARVRAGVVISCLVLIWQLG